MTTASAKQKGHRLVQRVREMLLQARPELHPDDIVVPAGSQPGCDLRLSPRAQEAYPFGVECKNTERLDVWGALKQCHANTPPGRVPLLIFSRNREPEPYACLPLSDLLVLLSFRPK